MGYFISFGSKKVDLTILLKQAGSGTIVLLIKGVSFSALRSESGSRLILLLLISELVTISVFLFRQGDLGMLLELLYVM